MLGEKREVNPYEYDEELDLRSPLRERGAGDRWESKSYPREDSEYGPYGEDVMEVSDHIIGIVERNVQGRVSQHNTRKPPYREKEEEAQHPKHGRLQGRRRAV